MRLRANDYEKYSKYFGRFYQVLEALAFMFIWLPDLQGFFVLQIEKSYFLSLFDC